MDWHDPDCRRIDPIPFDDKLWTCQACGTIGLLEFSIDEPAEAVTSSAHHEETHSKEEIKPLSWPSCVDYITDAPSEDIGRVLQQIQASQGMVCSGITHQAATVSDAYGREIQQVEYPKLTQPSHIRILELLPAPREKALEGRLLVVDVDKPPAYEALSYTWADASNDSSLCQRIFIGHGNRALPITSSCHQGLRHLRKELGSVFIWVDSVCINQSDLEERSYQVAMMDDVFSRANVVHAYVGEDEYGNSRKGTKAVPLLQSITEPARPPGREFKNHASAILDPFFQRPFFSRLWVVQEVLLARSVILHCGDKFTPITQDMVVKSQNNRVEIPWWMNHIGRIGPYVKSELVQVLAATALCQMSDLRDKIFGLLGLVDVEDASILAADYNLMVREVYIGTATYLIQKRGRHEILELSESLTNIEQRNTYGIPSWVPMWDLQQRPYVAADISQRLGDIQTVMNEGSARIPALSLPTWPSSQPIWNRSAKSIRKNIPLSTCEAETDLALEECYKAVDAKTGCLVTSGYEVAELKRSDFIKLLKTATFDEVHREVHYKAIRQGEVILAVSGPISTLRSTPQRVLGPSDYLALWRYLMLPREEGLAACNSTDSFLVKERENATNLYVRYAVVGEIESPSVSEDEITAWRLQLEEDPNWISRHESSLVDNFFTELLDLQTFWDAGRFEKLANLDLKTAQDDLNYCNGVLDTFATTDRSDKQSHRRKEKPGKVEAELSSWKAAWGLLYKRFNGLISVVLKEEANMFPQTVDDIFELPESWLGAYKNKQELVRLLEDRWMRCTRLLSFVIESAQCFEEAKQVMEGRREILGMFGVGREDERIVIE
ncbi:hypothetical protein ACHAPM_000137 [Fusarium culmorum]